MSLISFAPNVTINNNNNKNISLFSFGLSLSSFFFPLHPLTHTCCIASPIFILYSISACLHFLFISVSLCNAACHPLRPSSLLDIRELGRHLALRPRRAGWKNVCESHIVWGRVESPFSAFNSSQLLTVKVQVTVGVQWSIGYHYNDHYLLGANSRRVGNRRAN